MIKHVVNKKSKIKTMCTNEHCEVLRALSDKTRQDILMVFESAKEICANDIAEHFTLSRSTVSHHLNLMRRLKILHSRKDGKEIYYSVNKTYIKGLISSFLDIVDNYC